MDLNEYQAAAMRSQPKPSELDLAVFALGLTGEAGEVADMVKKIYGHGHPPDLDKLHKELGDVLWYIAAICQELGLSLADVAEANINKLMRRYPNGFSHEASRNRTE